MDETTKELVEHVAGLRVEVRTYTSITNEALKRIGELELAEAGRQAREKVAADSAATSRSVTGDKDTSTVVKDSLKLVGTCLTIVAAALTLATMTVKAFLGV